MRLAGRLNVPQAFFRGDGTGMRGHQRCLAPEGNTCRRGSGSTPAGYVVVPAGMSTVIVSVAMPTVASQSPQRANSCLETPLHARVTQRHQTPTLAGPSHHGRYRHAK